MSADEQLKKLGYSLPPAPSAVGIYRPAIVVGNLCYTSGHLPMTTEGELLKGCVGRTVDQEAGFLAARQSGLTMLSTLQTHLGSLDRIQRVIKLFGMVNCHEDFDQQPAVINGCSELMSAVFGTEHGIGAAAQLASIRYPFRPSWRSKEFSS